MAGLKFVSRLLILIALGVTLAACSGTGAVDRDQSLDGYTPEQIFERAEYELNRGRTDDAAWFFSEIERLYPYSSWAKRSLIMQA